MEIHSINSYKNNEIKVSIDIYSEINDKFEKKLYFQINLKK